MNQFFDQDTSIFQLCSKYPQAQEFLASNGFPQFSDSKKISSLGKNVSLAMVCKIRRIDYENLAEQLGFFLAELYSAADTTLVQDQKVKTGDLHFDGVLPCPVRIPFLEHFEQWLNTEKKTMTTIAYRLQSANLGTDWIFDKAATQDEAFNKLPDIAISVGFEMLFNQHTIGQFATKKLFKAIEAPLHPIFDSIKTDLTDPQRQYSVLGCVPAVFLVDTDALNGRKMPTQWSDLISGSFKDEVALPLADLDLFTSVLLDFYRWHGEDGVHKLIDAFKNSLHPAQMVKAGAVGCKDTPTISIVPYFFARLSISSKIQVVWPEDGAIISPMCLFIKKEKFEQAQDLVGFLQTAKTASVLSAEGFFPSTNINAQQVVLSDQKMRFIGFDYLYKTDIEGLIQKFKPMFLSKQPV